MAQRMLSIAPTKSCSLWTTIRELVAPALAMNTPFASHHVDWQEAGSSSRVAGSESAPTSSQPRKLEQRLGASDTESEEELKLIIDESMGGDPGSKTIYKFSAIREDSTFDDTSRTWTQTVSCSKPESSLKYLAEAIEYGFGLELDAVELIVGGNQFEMRYRNRPLFTCAMEVAESYMRYVIKTVRARWLEMVQRQLIAVHVSGRSRKCIRKKNLRIGFRVEAPADPGAVKRIQAAFHFLGKERISARFGTVSNETLATDWGKKVVGEVIKLWLGANPRNLITKVAFKCSGFIAEDMMESSGWPTAAFAIIFKDYIRSQLREHTGAKRAVIIRISDTRDDTFLIDSSSHDTCILESTGEQKGNWISISDVDDTGPRKILLCQASNFYTAFSDYLRAHDIHIFTNLKGYKRSGNENSESPLSSDCDLSSSGIDTPDLSALCPDALADLCEFTSPTDDKQQYPDTPLLRRLLSKRSHEGQSSWLDFRAQGGSQTNFGLNDCDMTNLGFHNAR